MLQGCIQECPTSYALGYKQRHLHTGLCRITSTKLELMVVLTGQSESAAVPELACQGSNQEGRGGVRARRKR